jgi:hypothetical protein
MSRLEKAVREQKRRAGQPAQPEREPGDRPAEPDLDVPDFEIEPDGSPPPPRTAAREPPSRAPAEVRIRVVHWIVLWLVIVLGVTAGHLLSASIASWWSVPALESMSSGPGGASPTAVVAAAPAPPSAVGPCGHGLAGGCSPRT